MRRWSRWSRLPVVQFAAGGVAIPADAALLMQLGCDGVFVGSVEVSGGLGEAMVGINLNDDKVERFDVV
ncbi:hypothetical protein DY000_02053479 [Brassica cretica]|uniref:PdxS/SNZ N-terminal domain-containing protein n=1 Tax=Brassica cretica TaxID=69181 RepID=A0ABQ7ADM5_BRACR|nr:hypothetical protein DY000_02053479 [Brassica cretica]